MKTVKANGLDPFCATMVNSCCEHFYKALLVLFEVFLAQCKVSSLWTTSETILVPRVALSLVMKDLKPVALTSVVMKCFEVIVKNYKGNHVDPLRDTIDFLILKEKV